MLSHLVLGHRKDGRPIYRIAGADQRGDLLLERTDLLARLASPAEGDDVEALTARAGEVADAIEAFNVSAAAAAEARARLAGAELPAQAPTPAPGQGTVPPAAGTAVPEQRVRPDLSGAFLASDSLAEFRARGLNGSASIEVPGEVRALFDSTIWPLQATRVPDMPQASQDRPLRIVDLIDRRPIGTNAIEYVREDTAVSGAAETAEGALKPEAAFTMTVVTDTARVIATWVNITRQTAEDNTQVMGYIEGRLTFGLNKRLEDSVLNGNGTAPNLRGILNTSGIGTYTAAAAEAAVISVRKAKTVAQLSEFEPDAVGMNPVDWERIELSADSGGMFRVTPNAQASLTPRIWGLNVVTSTVFTATVVGTTGGSFLVGAFREGATLWERDGVRILMTDSHASNFTSNILTLLVEMRAALSVWRPKAFVKGTFGNAGN